MNQKIPTVAIIGGGFTGAAIAWHLAGDASLPPTRIVVIEPRQRLGGGLAYSSTDPAFRINVPAARMSIDPGEPDDFSSWLAETEAAADDPEASFADGRVFPRRSVFGDYVADRLAPSVEAGRIEHLPEQADAIAALPGTYRIRMRSGATLDADLVALAVTHPPPEPPATLKRALEDHPRFVPDTTLPEALAVVRPDDRVLVVGTGLTGADIIASLDRSGHRGPITAISRRGLRSRGHAPVALPARGDFSSDPARTVRQLLGAIRRELASAQEVGESWHPVFDALRNQGPAIWAALPVTERRRLVRHLRPYWDVHRFRIAPQVEAVLERKEADGSLVYRKGSVRGAFLQGEEIVVEFQLRDAAKVERFDAVLVATGPAHGGILAASPLLASLAAAGLVRADPVGLGIETDHDGRALSKAGAPTGTLLVGGPLARGTFGELMGLPEVAAYARFIAERIGDWRRVSGQ